VEKRKVLIIGGGGYVGTELQEYLLGIGFEVRVLDTFWYPDGMQSELTNIFKSGIEYVRADVRDKTAMVNAMVGITDCIHLACISNDPSYELDPKLSESINFLAFKTFIGSVNQSEIQRVIYASSSSVYGVKTEPNVTEELPCEPRTDYSKFKVACESELLSDLNEEITASILRPSTVCGVSNRQRFDLVVNALTINALVNGVINVDGGEQYRPNLHIKDMLRAYAALLEADANQINREIFNVAGENLKVIDIARKVQQKIDKKIEIKIIPVIDDRSYRVSGAKIERVLKFSPLYTVENAIEDIQLAYLSGKFKDTTDEKYYNLKTMKRIIAEGTLRP
jgi:nucleoside-diphosphate-sugar epimerase